MIIRVTIWQRGSDKEIDFSIINLQDETNYDIFMGKPGGNWQSYLQHLRPYPCTLRFLRSHTKGMQCFSLDQKHLPNTRNLKPKWRIKKKMLLKTHSYKDPKGKNRFLKNQQLKCFPNVRIISFVFTVYSFFSPHIPIFLFFFLWCLLLREEGRQRWMHMLHNGL